MTPEEAIRVIEVAKAECEWNAPLDYQTAFDVAIEALKAQPKHDQNTPQKQPDLETLGVKTGKTCADAISRQDAIEELSYLQTYLFDSRDHDNKVSLEDVRYAIEQLPSAQPEQRWIPCGERLPDTNRDVLLQFNTNKGVGFWENGEWGVNTGDNIYSEIGEEEAKPIAWMELPKPYEGES